MSVVDLSRLNLIGQTTPIEVNRNERRGLVWGGEERNYTQRGVKRCFSKIILRGGLVPGAFFFCVAPGVCPLRLLLLLLRHRGDD